MRCSLLEPSAEHNRLVYTNDLKGGAGHDKIKAGANNRCDDDGNKLKYYATK